MSSPDQDRRDERDTAIQVVQPVAPIEQLKKSMQEFERLKRELLTEDDWQQIGDKKYITRSGFRKISLAFGLSDQILEEHRAERADGSFTWRVKVRVWARNGRRSESVGACDSSERKFAHLEHDVYATAHTRAKSRAISDLVAGGAVSAEELEGQGSPVRPPVPPAHDTSQPRVKNVVELTLEEAEKRPGPPKGQLSQDKLEGLKVPDWTPGSRPSTGNQRAMISVLCREYKTKYGVELLKTILERTRAGNLEILTFDQAEAVLKWMEGL